MNGIVSPIALKIAGGYALVSTLWILLSDQVVHTIFPQPEWFSVIEVLKGWFFVAITALLLYKLIASYTGLLVDSEKKLQKNNEELATAYEELLAAEEELRQQLEELLDRDVKITRRNECLNALHEAALALIQEVTADDILENVVTKMMKIGEAQFGYIYLLDEQDNVMIPKIIKGFSLDQINAHVQPGEGIIGIVWQSGEPLIINNYHAWEHRLREPIYSTLRAGVGIPLKLADRVIGVISMNYTNEHIIDDEELQMFNSFSELAAIALGNAHLHDALQLSESRKQALIDALPDSIFQLDQNGILLDYKQGKEFQLLVDMAGKIGSNATELLPVEVSQELMAHVNEALLTGTTQCFEYKLLHNDVVRYREARITASSPQEAIVLVRDISERNEMEQQLQHIALHDKVTGLYNRVYFEEELQRLDNNRQVPVGVIVCDIDGLKLVNDTFGHQAGDKLLVSAGKIMRDCFPAGDVVARVGGDEFAIVLLNKDRAEVEQACHRIRSHSSAFRDVNTQIPISISIGMSVRTNPDQSMNEIFKDADDNMYREKLHSSQSTRSAIVQTLAKALEARDFVTDGHADRLQEWVAKLAVAVKLPDSRLPDMRLLARFHDVGKVGIPDQILFKPSRLTEEEYTVMKRHCEIGYRIAHASGELAPIADWILKHQEWWNGKGYPLGLSGEEIPLACRILAIADAYDAMTNDRPYRQAMSCAEAMDELERCAGTQFDPELVQVFKQLIRTDVDN